MEHSKAILKFFVHFAVHFHCLSLAFAVSSAPLIIFTVDWVNTCVLIIYGRSNNAGNVGFHILHKPNLVATFISCPLNSERDIECYTFNVHSWFGTEKWRKTIILAIVFLSFVFFFVATFFQKARVKMWAKGNSWQRAYQHRSEEKLGMNEICIYRRSDRNQIPNIRFVETANKARDTTQRSRFRKAFHHIAQHM